jgi:hypothetical protein
MKRLALLFLLIMTVALTAPGTDADENEENVGTGWYKTQVGTGIGNCGPASAAMGIKWSTGDEVSVQDVRGFIGYSRPDGSTDFLELCSALRNYGASYELIIVSSLTGLKNLIELDDLIAIVLIDTEHIEYDIEKDVLDPKEIFDRNYDYEVGHYIVLGDVVSNYFVIQDPLPPGENRRYHVEEVWNALRDRRIIVIRNYEIARGD